MVASISNIPKNSNVYRFITSGKPGKCELCPLIVEKLEAHHISYEPEITIKLCHSCHHKVHFWPSRLNSEEKIKLLEKKFNRLTAEKLVSEDALGPQALPKLVAPSRKTFIHEIQKIEARKSQIPKFHELKKIQAEKVIPVKLNSHKPADKKLFKPGSLSFSDSVSWEIVFFCSLSLCETDSYLVSSVFISSFLFSFLVLFSFLFSSLTPRNRERERNIYKL